MTVLLNRDTLSARTQEPKTLALLPKLEKEATLNELPILVKSSTDIPENSLEVPKILTPLPKRQNPRTDRVLPREEAP